MNKIPQLLELGLLTVLSCSWLIDNANAAPVRLEAEDMSRSGFRTESLSSASNGVVINLKGPATTGSATTLFDGASGSFDVFVGYHDENDGIAQLSVMIGGVLLDRWDLDTSVGGSQPQAQNFLVRKVAEGYVVSNGDLIELGALQGKWDNANIDYIEFVPQGSGGPPVQPNIVDFSAGLPVTIDEPGYYVLDRDWTLDEDDSDVPALEILADQVTFDLRGFAIEFRGHPAGILITGNGAALHNGTLSSRTDRDALVVSGADAQIDEMRIKSESYSTGIVLGGLRGKIANSVITSGDDGEAIRVAGSGSVVQSNQIRVAHYAVIFSALSEIRPAQVLDNVISCGHEDCIWVRGNQNVIARNTITKIDTSSAMTVRGNDNLILDNTILDQHDSGHPAIVIDGTRNIINGNIVQPRAPEDGDDPWMKGIEFLQDGNYYGDNLVSAIAPFALGGTAQIDLGGNVAL